MKDSAVVVSSGAGDFWDRRVYTTFMGCLFGLEVAGGLGAGGAAAPFWPTFISVLIVTVLLGLFLDVTCPQWLSVMGGQNAQDESDMFLPPGPV